MHQKMQSAEHGSLTVTHTVWTLTMGSGGPPAFAAPGDITVAALIATVQIAVSKSRFTSVPSRRPRSWVRRT